MTHSLHRVRLHEEDRDDFVLLCTPAIGFNHEQCKDRLLKILDLILEYEPENINFYEADKTMDLNEIRKAITDTSRLRCCFIDPGKVRRLLKVLKEKDFGISIVISGHPEAVEQLMQKADVEPHTINMACGCHGSTEKLPDNKTLALISMCGHGLIGPALVQHMADKVKNGDASVKEAARMIGLPCSCGIYNTVRAELILDRMVNEYE